MAPRTEVRLRVKPHTAARGHVDGAWWPRSRDPAIEFPGLVLATSSWVGPVRRVDYNLDEWDTAAGKLVVEGWLVSLTGSATFDAHTVMVACTDQRRMRLLVIPPDTLTDIARAVLIATTGPDVTGSVEEILASNGIDLRKPPVAR